MRLVHPPAKIASLFRLPLRGAKGEGESFSVADLEHPRWIGTVYYRNMCCKYRVLLGLIDAG